MKFSDSELKFSDSKLKFSDSELKSSDSELDLVNIETNGQPHPFMASLSKLHV